MNYLFIAITAYLLNAVAVTIDKILLVKKLPNPALYVFYISVFSLVVFLAAPLTNFPSTNVFMIASASTILWTFGAYYMFKALKTGEAVRVIPIIGTLIPIILLFMSSVSGSINLNEVWAIIFLVLGLICLIYPYLKGKFSREEIGLELISALFFANSYFLLKAGYEQSNFLSVFVYSKLILIPVILAILAFPFLRKWVFSDSQNHRPAALWSKTGLLLFIGQISGGVSQFLLAFAISLASPAVINSIQGIQYVFLFILGLMLSKKFPLAFDITQNRSHLLGKIAGIILIFFGLWILSFGSATESKPKLGITFSSKYAVELGIDPLQIYQAILRDLKPELIRIPVYWDEVEPSRGEYNFSQTENLIKMAEDFGSDVILVVGFKQPRWPECFQPKWANNLEPEEFNNQVIKLVKTEVETFKKYPNIKYWQVENEPFVAFGVCPKPNPQRLSQEIETVKSLDPRPIMITDSGELSLWFESFNLGDVFGTTLYRSVWSPYFGTISYPLPPLFYNLKAKLASFVFNTQNKLTMISELQAEPWPNDGKTIPKITLLKQQSLFPVKQLEKNLNFAKEARMGPILFWGVEWWYYMKLKGIPDYWNQAKIIFND